MPTTSLSETKGTRPGKEVETKPTPPVTVDSIEETREGQVSVRVAVCDARAESSEAKR